MKKVLVFVVGLVFLLPIIVKAEDVTSITTGVELYNCLSVREDKNCELSNDVVVNNSDIGEFKINNDIKLNLNGHNITLNDVYILVYGKFSIFNVDSDGNLLSDGSISGGGLDPSDPDSLKYLIWNNGTVNIYGGTFSDGCIYNDYKIIYSSVTTNIYDGNFYSDIYNDRYYFNIYGGNFYGKINLSFNKKSDFSRLVISGGYFQSNAVEDKKIYNGGSYSSDELSSLYSLIIKDGYEMVGSLSMPTSEYIYFPQKFAVLKKVVTDWDSKSAKWNSVDGATSYKVSLYKDGNVLDSYNNMSVNNTSYDFYNILLSNGTGTYKYSVSACNKDVCGTVVNSSELSIETYSLNFKNIDGSVIYSNNIESNNKASVPDTPVKDGYVFDGWYIDNELTQVYDFNNIVNKDTVLYAKWEKSYTYNFVLGNNQQFVSNKIDAYSFRIDGDFSLFDSLKISDLILVKDTDYTVTEGSTIITFTEDGINKLNTLSPNKYDIVVKYSNGNEVAGILTILDNTVNNDDKNEESNPKTYDMIITWIVLSLVSLGGIVAILVYKKKKNI